MAAGDLSRLTPEQRAGYYGLVCESLGLNPYTRPFEFLSLQGKLTLYARRDATDQLRRIHRVSTEVVGREQREELYVVTARTTTPDGRSDEAVGAVPIAGLRGEALAAAIMKAETKAKRRVTLSIVGRGWTDESELSGIPNARVVRMEVATPTAPVALAALNRPTEIGPLRRNRDALLQALARAGMEAEPLADDASAEVMRSWIERQRAALRQRAA